MQRPTIEDAPVKEPMRPHALSYDARYADRDWFSRAKWYRARKGQNAKRRAKTRKTIAY